MKKLSLLLLFFSFNVFSQQNEAYKKYSNQLKAENKIDSEDKSVFDLLDEFYNQVLQSETGELSSEIPKKIEQLYQGKKTKNRHLLLLFLAYQDHITKTAAVGKKPNSNFQVALMNDLESEFQSIFNKIPAIIYIYKAEAYFSNGQQSESLKTIESGLTVYPDSVPLKVYKYLDTKNEDLKKDLLLNHSKHWMVKQFEIQ
ncbi:hypothetical protein [Flavobacterium sp. GCM10027622]|uniref:hypothetical protein n=1 Tax=unclassified Flavobacterium TaxID=196869 RepID=UPI003620D3D7